MILQKIAGYVLNIVFFVFFFVFLFRLFLVHMKTELNAMPFAEALNPAIEKILHSVREILPAKDERILDIFVMSVLILLFLLVNRYLIH